MEGFAHAAVGCPAGTAERGYRPPLLRVPVRLAGHGVGVRVGCTGGSMQTVGWVGVIGR